MQADIFNLPLSELIRLTGEYHQRNGEAKEGNMVGPF